VINVRAAKAADVDGVTEAITSAFYNDPTWSWAFPDPNLRWQQHTSFWALHAQSMIQQGWAWTTDGCEAAALWVPPGGSELLEAQEALVEPMLREMLGDHAQAVMELLDRFDAAHPKEQPHYYLSLWGTHTDHRGKGIGRAVIEHNLALIDAENAHSYLESSNPANNAHYEKMGFEQIGEFSCPGGGPMITTMWREAR